MTPPPQLTATELRQQMLHYVAETMDATGYPDGWWRGTSSIDKLPWIPEEYEYSAFDCDGTGPEDAQQYGQYLSHDPGADSVELAERVVARWLELGYPVSLVSSPSTVLGVIRVTEYRADLTNGVYLGLFSSDKVLGIHVTSSCSTHPSLYADDDTP